MPNNLSAKKRLKQNKKKRAKNNVKKERFKDLRKRIESLVEEGQISDAKELLPKFFKAVDKASKTNVIHENKAARLKSKVSKTVKEN